MSSKDFVNTIIKKHKGTTKLNTINSLYISTNSRSAAVVKLFIDCTVGRAI